MYYGIKYYKMKCFNCGKDGEDGDKYCRYCGAYLKKVEDEPTEIICGIVYGPPPTKIKHKCPQCGYEWNSYEDLWGNEKSKEQFCPKCSARAFSKNEGF